MEPVKHPKALKSVRETMAYRCSKHHTFYAVPREVERAHRLRGEARSSRREADEQIRHARGLRRASEHVLVIADFVPIDTKEAVQKARDTAQKSRETRARAQRTRKLSQNLAEQAKQSLHDGKNKRGQRLSRPITPEG